MIRDVTEATWQADVLDRSAEVPVVVDFWAEWCGPCRALGPALESAAQRRDGRIDLAKVDVDSNQGLSQTFQVQGIPAVKAFRNGEVAAEFTGALPPADVEKFFDGLVPSEADELAGSEDEAGLRRALELDPGQALAVAKLGAILLARGENEEAAELLGRFPNDFVAVGMAARATLAADGRGPVEAWEAWDAGDAARALEHLQVAFAACTEEDERDLLRRAMVAIFTELGPDHELAREHRRRLSAAMF